MPSPSGKVAARKGRRMRRSRWFGGMCMVIGFPLIRLAFGDPPSPEEKAFYFNAVLLLRTSVLYRNSTS